MLVGGGVLLITPSSSRCHLSYSSLRASEKAGAKRRKPRRVGMPRDSLPSPGLLDEDVDGSSDFPCGLAE
jgi:hypothetical protein